MLRRQLEPALAAARSAPGRGPGQRRQPDADGEDERPRARTARSGSKSEETQRGDRRRSRGRAAPPATAEMARAALSRPCALLSRRGSSPISRVPSPIVAAEAEQGHRRDRGAGDADRVLAEVARRNHQKAAPRKDVTTAVPTIEPALVRIVRLSGRGCPQAPVEGARCRPGRSPRPQPGGVVDRDRARCRRCG